MGINGFLYGSATKNGFLTGSGQCSTDSGTYYLDNKKVAEDRLTPDSWKVSGFGVNGRLFIKNGKFHFVFSPGKLGSIDGEDPVKVEYQTNEDGTIRSFIITDTNGVRYVYGMPVYEVLGEAKLNRFPISDKYVLSKITLLPMNKGEIQYAYLKPYAYAWYLTAVLSPDFKGDPFNPKDSDKGNWIKIGYEKVYSKFEFRGPFGGKLSSVDHLSGYMACPEDFINNRAIAREGRLLDCSTYVVHGYMEIVYPKYIETPLYKAEFFISDRDDGPEYSENTHGFKSGRYLKKLDEIRLISKANNRIVSVIKFDYDYTLNKGIPSQRVPGRGKLTLKSVQQFGYDGKAYPPLRFESVSYTHLTLPTKA